MKFIDNIQKNKLKDIREELYQFMMAGRMPITHDGCFLAYKAVRRDYHDKHTGTMDNSPGTLVAMEPSQVDTNRNNECSRGLHFCARGYLPNFAGSGDRVMIVKVNPRFVFAIPRDYNCAKGRASEYYVIGEETGSALERDSFLADFVFDEKKLQEIAPSVKFIEKDTHKPSLLAMAQGYKLVGKDGKVLVRVMTTKGAFTSDKYQVVVRKDKEYISAETGKPVPREHIKSMSFETKSVRSAMVRAVARSRNRK
jgi:hypothetical protein